MKSLRKLITLTTIITVIIFSACNNSSNKKSTTSKDQNEAAIEQRAKTISENINIVIKEKYFEIEKIINKGFIAFANIDYKQNKIKIAIPAYSESDNINVSTSNNGKHLVIDIEVAENGNNFTHTAYIDIDVTDVNQFDYYQININGNQQALFTKIIEKESITGEPGNYNGGDADFTAETFVVPQHFFDYFKNDSLISIFDNETSSEIDIIDFEYYQSQLNTISLDSSANYLFVHIDEDQDYQNPINTPRINYYTINLDNELNKKKKVKVTRSHRYRKTISKYTNKDLNTK
jgi:hypothetical protein